MADQNKSYFLPDQLLQRTLDHLQSTSRPYQPQWKGRGTASFITEARKRAAAQTLTRLHQHLADRDAQPATSISSFMAVVAAVNPPFKPRTLHRPWSISAGHGAHGSVDVHRYVPGRNFNVFNDSSSLKLSAYEPDPRLTGEYYAVKRLSAIDSASDNKAPQQQQASKQNAFALLADELRILAHPDLRGHPNIVYLFGVSHTPSRSGVGLTEPNLVLQEGDCGDLFSFYRDVDMRFNRHTLIEVKLSLCFDIACGIEALHRHGVVHCDLKPQNILIRRRLGRNQPVQRFTSETEAGTAALQSLMGQSPFVAMLADFGGSTIMSDVTKETLLPKVWTPLWCAPECYSGKEISKSLLPRIDIYSAGLIFAFIFLEGRDIFSEVVHRGSMHQYDTTLSPDAVRTIKTSGAALALAKAEILTFETTVFGVTATGERVYISREQMYPPAVLKVFNAILDLALQVDPNTRVKNATGLLQPWHQALQGNFHVNNSLHYSRPAAFQSFASGKMGQKDYFSRGKTCAKSPGNTCTEVPSPFSGTAADLSPGVFDIRTSFKVFRASLTSNLKKDIVDDLEQEVNTVQTIKQLTLPPSGFEDVVSKSQLRRAADCAYQVCIAYVEGFGRSRDDREALKWMRISADWGSPLAQTDFLPLSLSLGVPQDKEDDSFKWTVNSVAQKGHQRSVNALWTISQEACNDALRTYREEQVMANFNLLTGQSWQRVFLNSKKGLPLADDGRAALHSAMLMPSSGLMGTLAWETVQSFIAKADVRALTTDSTLALDVVMACGNVAAVRCLLDKHEQCNPSFLPGSCPLQNIARLPADVINEVVGRVLKMAPQTVDSRIPATGRTALLNTLLTKEPLNPSSRMVAITALLTHGANPLLTTDEPGTASPLLLSVEELDVLSVKAMLGFIKKHGHATPLLNPVAARPEPANELARAFFRLMQTPRSVTMMRGATDYKQSMESIVKILLQYDVSTELPFVCRASPHDALGLGCYYGHDEAMQAILVATKGTGPAVTKTLGWGSTSGIDALGTAIDCGFGEAADLLLQRRAVATRRDLSKLLLHDAVHHQPALVPQLFGHFERVGRGAEVLAYEDQWGATIFDLALEYAHFDLARFLLSKGATYDVHRLKGDHSIDEGRQSTLASVLPRMEPIRFLMELTPKPSLVVSSTGLNVFHVLAADDNLTATSGGRAGFLDALRYFHALDPTLIHARGGTQGFTPFHLVSLHYSETVGEFLHEHGADINAVSAKGHTPLDILHLHDEGDRGVDGHLTIDYRGGAPRTGVAVCDYALAGPVYWKLEGKLSVRLKELYKSWGARRGLSTMMRQLGLQEDSLFGGGITAYYEGSDGEEHAEHFFS